MLARPGAGGSYPPRELVRVLTKFGERIQEAMPILLEALGVSDYETRVTRRIDPQVELWENFVNA